MAYYPMEHHQNEYSSPFTQSPFHQSSPFQPGAGDGCGGVVGGYQHSPFTSGASPSSQMETSSYLPAYLLGGTSSTSPRKSKYLPFNQVTQPGHASSPLTISATTSRGYTNDRIHEVKPGGPPVQSLHDTTASPVRPHPQMSSGGVSTPERRQLTFSGTKTLPRFNANTTAGHTPSSMPPSPGNTSARAYHSGTVSRQNDNTGLVQPSPLSPGQMDPFYTQGDQINSESTFNEHWITVFGFPPASTSYILEQFAQYGNIMSHKTSAEGNWVHIQYQTKLQAKKALSKNGRIYSDGIMVGVQPCIDQSIIEGTSSLVTGTPTHSLGAPQLAKKPSTMRPLTAAYQASSSTHGVATDTANTPQKSSSFISRTLEYVFGW